MAKQAWETVVAFKLVWMRVIGYFAVPAWMMWDSLTAGVTGAQWEAMHNFERFCLIGKCVAAGVIPFLAFIDKSTSEAEKDLKYRRGQAEFLTKDTGP